MPRTTRTSTKVAPKPKHTLSVIPKKPVEVSQPNTQNTSAMKPQSFGEIVKEGFGFGVGQAAAHSIFRSLFGGTPATVAPTQPTPVQPTAYQQCIKEHTEEECKFLDNSE